MNKLKIISENMQQKLMTYVLLCGSSAQATIHTWILQYYNITRHTVHTVAAWPNLKMVNGSYFRFDYDDKIKYTNSHNHTYILHIKLP